MPKKLSTVLGIDIGTRQIKIAEVKMQGKEPAITALGVAPTPENAADQTGVFDVEPIADVIKALIHQSGSTAPFAVISIAGQQSVLVRTLEVPRMNPKELAEHMQWEISRNIPFAESNIEQDFKAYEPKDAAAQNLDVVMAISPRTAIDTLADIVKKSGKKAFAIDVEPLGIGRSQTASYKDLAGDQTVCVVDIGHLSTAINMYKEDQLLMPRMVPLGGQHFTQAIQDALGMSTDDAETAKHRDCVIPDSAGLVVAADPFGSTQAFEAYNPFPTADPMAPVQPYSAGDVTPYNPGAAEPEPEFNPYAVDTPANPYAEEANPYAAADNPYAEPEPAPSFEPTPPPPVPVDPVPAPIQVGGDVRYYNAIAGILDEFLSEVRRSIDYFKSKGGDVSLLLLAGGGAQLKGLPSFLERTLGIPVQVYDSVRGLPLAGKRIDPSLIEKHRPEFAVAIGNALHICFD